MESYLPSIALVVVCAIGLLAARPLVSLSLWLSRAFRLRRLADFWEARREATVVAMRVTCSLILTISVLEMIFRRTHLG